MGVSFVRAMSVSEWGDHALTGCPGIVERARSKACGCPRTSKFDREIRIGLLAKKVATGVKRK